MKLPMYLTNKIDYRALPIAGESEFQVPPGMSLKTYKRLVDKNQLNPEQLEEVSLLILQSRGVTTNMIWYGVWSWCPLFNVEAPTLRMVGPGTYGTQSPHLISSKNLTSSWAYHKH